MGAGPGRTRSGGTGVRPWRSRRSAFRVRLRPPPAASGPALNLRSPAHRTERELLKLALQRPELVSPAFDAYGVDEFTAPPYAAVRRAVEDAGGAEQGIESAPEYLARVREAAPNDAVRALVTELAVEVFHGKSIDEAYAGSSSYGSGCALSTSASTM